MRNPNYGHDKLVSDPEFAKETFRTLRSSWLQLPDAITVPAESFLYAYDTKAYREQVQANFAGQKELERPVPAAGPPGGGAGGAPGCRR
jgi:hypothetical protein